MTATAPEKTAPSADQISLEKRGGRNFAIHIPPDRKEILRQLAAASQMSLTEYVEAILNQSVRDKDVFEKEIRLVAKSNR